MTTYIEELNQKHTKEELKHLSKEYQSICRTFRFPSSPLAAEKARKEYDRCERLYIRYSNAYRYSTTKELMDSLLEELDKD